ncbi:MAG: formylglycine-generating enzyme family protein, partial [Planctomycetota bacterium]
ILTAAFVFVLVGGGFAFAACPSADLSGDCFVDFEDFAVIGAQWLNGYDWNDVNKLANQWLTTDPCVPDDMAYIPDGEFDMGDHHGDGYSDELPVHAVLLDSFFMSKFEITNQQYCDYLNSAYDACDIKVDGGIVFASSDSSNSYPYCDTYSYGYISPVDYNHVTGTFSVKTKGGRDMSDDPVVELSWYGAAAYCNWRSQQEGKEQCYDLSTWTCDFNKKGYRLPTEAEWEYAARGGLSGKRFPWGDTVSHSQANYYADPCSCSYDESPTTGYHPMYYDGIQPSTAPVGSFQANDYGVYDMTGNVWEWCHDWYDSGYYDASPYDNPPGPANGTGRVLRGGGWSYVASYCRVATRYIICTPACRFGFNGFRVVLDLN